MVPSETWEQNAFSVWPPLIAGTSGVQKLNTSEYVECPGEEGSNQELDGMLSVSCLFLSRCWHRWSSRPRNTQCEQCLAKYTVPLWAHAAARARYNNDRTRGHREHISDSQHRRFKASRCHFFRSCKQSLLFDNSQKLVPITVTEIRNQDASTDRHDITYLKVSCTTAALRKLR